MTVRYRGLGDEWRTVCPALRHHGAVIGGETREEALTHSDNAIFMILADMELEDASPPADEPVLDSVVLTFTTKGEAE